jgi:hypothetical protein
LNNKKAEKGKRKMILSYSEIIMLISCINTAVNHDMFNDVGNNQANELRQKLINEAVMQDEKEAIDNS